MTSPPPRQLALGLPHRPSVDREDFLVSASNAEAIAWLDRWPAWPAPALVIHGPAGCGKTHLAQMFLAQTGGVAIDELGLATEPPDRLLGGAAVAVFDDADRSPAAGLEEALLHLFNTAKELKCALLLTAAAPPARWPLRLPDLRSRLNGCPAAAISPPDDALIAALLVKLFADRQVRVDAGVIDYLVPRMRRSFDAARRLVGRLDDTALAARQPIGLALARTVLAEEAAGEP